eukprot:jgi/Botrbrau1/23587/Bobra.0141s0051.1
MLVRCGRWESAGLASAANNLFLAFPVFYGTNGTFFLDNRDFAYSCSESEGWQNGWHDFFVTDDVLNWKPAHERDFGNVCRRANVGMIHPLLQDVQLSYNDLQTASALKLWKLQPWVQFKVNAALKRANEQPRPTIGFHMRGGDKVSEDEYHSRKFTTPEDMVSTFETTWPSVKGGTCIIVGDDGQQVAALSDLAAKKLGCRIYTPHPYHPKGGHSQGKFNEQVLPQRCAQTVQLIADMEILAHTDYMVGTYNSGIPGLVEILRYALYKKSRLTFADAFLAPPRLGSGHPALSQGCHFLIPCSNPFDGPSEDQHLFPDTLCISDQPRRGEPRKVAYTPNYLSRGFSERTGRPVRWSCEKGDEQNCFGG